MTVHCLTNRTENFQFEINGEIATLSTINAAIGRNGGLISVEKMSKSEARNQWLLALKHGCVEGWTEASLADPEAPLYID